MNHVRAFLVLAIFAIGTTTATAQKIASKDLRNGPEVLKAFRSVVATPSESTVRVLADGKEVALGTIVESDGWILSKWSEVQGKKKLTCKLKSGKVLDAKIVGFKDDSKANAAYDLVMLKVEAKDLVPVDWRDSKEAKVGKWVASPGTGTDPVAIGVVSVATREYKQLDQPPRNSNINAGYLGISSADVKGGGVKVTGVGPKTPAEKAGVKVDDVIYEAANRKIIDFESLINTLDRLKPGDNIVLKVTRGDDDLELKVTLGKRPPQMAGNPQERMGAKLSTRRGGFPVILQHDSGIRPEDCGGPLVDLDGKTVGINISRAGRTETYALPSERVRSLISELKSGKLAPKDED